MIKLENNMDELELTVRSYNVLKRAGCRTVQDVADLTTSGRLARVRGAGKRVVTEVGNRLKELGFIEVSE